MTTLDILVYSIATTYKMFVAKTCQEGVTSRLTRVEISITILIGTCTRQYVG